MPSTHAVTEPRPASNPSRPFDHAPEDDGHQVFHLDRPAHPGADESADRVVEFGVQAPEGFFAAALRQFQQEPVTRVTHRR
jgi:hypothetical protein